MSSLSPQETYLQILRSLIQNLLWNTRDQSPPVSDLHLVDEAMWHFADEGIELEEVMIKGFLRSVRVHNRALEKRLRSEVEENVALAAGHAHEVTWDQQLTPPASPSSSKSMPALRPMSRQMEKAFVQSGMPGVAVDDLWRKACDEVGALEGSREAGSCESETV